MMVVFLWLSLMSLFFPDVNGQCSGTTEQLSVGFTPVTVSPPGYPDGYGTNLYCTWQASTSIPGTPIVFTIHDLTAPCSDDVINVYDGTSTSGTHIVQNECALFEGSIRTIGLRVATSGSVYAVFQTDNITSPLQKGFKMWLLAADDFSGTGCSGTPQSLTATTTEQYLTSPDFPNTYALNTDCSWIITSSDSNSNVLVKVWYNDIEYHDTCGYDYLRVEDNGTVLSTFCETNWQWRDPPANFTSSGQSITITFHSDNVGIRTGFFLSYILTGNPETTTPETTTVATTTPETTTTTITTQETSTPQTTTVAITTPETTTAVITTPETTTAAITTTTTSPAATGMGRCEPPGRCQLHSRGKQMKEMRNVAFREAFLQRLRGG